MHNEMVHDKKSIKNDNFGQQKILVVGPPIVTFVFIFFRANLNMEGQLSRQERFLGIKAISLRSKDFAFF